MTAFETNVLDVLEKISLQQSSISAALLTLSEQQVVILDALSKESNDDSITATLEALLKPLVAGLANLSARLPPLSDK